MPETQDQVQKILRRMQQQLSQLTKTVSNTPQLDFFGRISPENAPLYVEEAGRARHAQPYPAYDFLRMRDPDGFLWEATITTDGVLVWERL